MAEQVKLPDEELEVIQDWGQVIDDLRRHAKTGDEIDGLQPIDWYTKRNVFTRWSEKKGGLSGKDLQAATLIYDKTIDGIGVKLRQPGGPLAKSMPTAEELEAADYMPPQGRARVRGDFIEVVNDDYLKSKARVDWSYVKYKEEQRDLPLSGDYSKTQRERILSELIEGYRPKK